MDTELSKGDKKNKFIELRAKEVSYDNIAKELNVSKPTLISWAKELNTEIHNIRQLQRDSLREQYAIGKQHRLEMLSEQLKKMREELAKRDLADIPSSQLLTMVMKLEARIAEEDDGITTFIEQYEGLRLDMSSTDSWNG